MDRIWFAMIVAFSGSGFGTGLSRPVSAQLLAAVSAQLLAAVTAQLLAAVTAQL
jgi:hypothetical protein